MKRNLVWLPLLFFALAFNDGIRSAYSDMMKDSPVTFPKEGALPAKYPPDRSSGNNEATEKDDYIFRTPERSIEQIEKIQAEMPKGEFTAPANDWVRLIRTYDILTNGGDLRLLALGDSIVNDTMRSGWVAKLQEAYPKANIRATVYVRGGGGCQHYKEESRIAKNAIPRRPDLVLIGGIGQKDMESIREVIRQLRSGLPEVEILLFTGAFGTADPRDPEALDRAPHSGTGPYGQALKTLAAEERCAYLDLTAPWADYIRSAKVHPHRFYRDAVHANEQGEQILAKIMLAFFKIPALASLPDNTIPDANQAACDVVSHTPGLVAFWTFSEEPGAPRRSNGTKETYPLQEVGGPIERVEGGPYSGYSVQFDGKHYFRIPYSDLGSLDICGATAQVSMFAIVRMDDMSRGTTIAGIWSEGKGANDDSGTRQYAMLLNMPMYGGLRQLTPHISSEGGVTRRADGSAFPWCADYAASRSEVPVGKWVTLGFTYDGEWIRAYYNGVMEERPLDPEKDKRTDRYFTHEGPGGGPRGMNPYFHGRGIFCYDPSKYGVTKPGGGADFTVGARYAVGSMLGEALKARLGGLAVFNRALTDIEIMRLHESANLTSLNNLSQ